MDRRRHARRRHPRHGRADRRLPQAGVVAAVSRRQARARARALTDLDELVGRCTFPTSSPVACAFSGGADSTALIALARHAGLEVVAHHVDHGLRASSADEARQAAAIAAAVGADVVVHRVVVDAGPNLEARARAARRAVLPDDAMTGHTADDQAETVLLRLLRGGGSRGLGAMTPGHRHPLLALRRTETHAVCRQLDLDPVHDPSNDTPDGWRNRVRSELLPLAADIAGRDLVPILVRSADLLRSESDLLDAFAAELDPTDAVALAAAPAPLARRALRRWLTEGGYPPDADAVDRVLAVVEGSARACELPGGRRVERSAQRLRLVDDRSVADR
ncbi:MAG: tRNA lysidine(34) synthetase TilS [Ilumatobacter sp.]|nr:tRNA lysidine(34) synthetase TilS [Ilumatobacter sp.]